MNIDWRKAPKGTTGAMVAHFDGGETRRGDVEFIPSDEPSRYIYEEGPDSWVYHPAPSATHWNGEGLPPVGTVCEDDAGNQVVIVAHHVNGVNAIFAESLDSGLLYYGAAGEFRPIRTPEQIAEEEREKAIEEMWQVYWQPDAPTAKQALGLLYDAGYRRRSHDH